MINQLWEDVGDTALLLGQVVMEESGILLARCYFEDDDVMLTY